MGEVVCVLICAVILLGALFFYWRPDRAATRQVRFAKARHDFHARREWLEAKFIQLAAARSKSRSPRWDDCTFADDVTYVRHRSTGQISALVEISIAAEDPEDIFPTGGDAVGNLQLGTAVFRLDRDRWVTDGRAILNFSPAETLRQFQRDYQFLGEEYGSG
ncbi:MAG: hypothetical protein JXB10_04745 [Pirellulales bacterium]|nr:hypothetical protein [Pirellulales bacterium]